MTSFVADEARTIDPNGSVSLTVTEWDGSTKLRSVPWVLPGVDEFAALDAFARQWVLDHASEIAPYVPPTLQEEIARAKQSIVLQVDLLTAPVLRAYPEAERAAWLSKEQEALAYLAKAEGDRTPSDAPLLNAVCENQFGPQDTPSRLVSIAAKATVVIAKADTWRGLTAYVEGFRSRFDLTLGAAETTAEVTQALADADAEMAVAKVQFGL